MEKHSFDKMRTSKNKKLQAKNKLRARKQPPPPVLIGLKMQSPFFLNLRNFKNQYKAVSLLHLINSKYMIRQKN